jgi:hypothetical protein
MEVSTTRTTTYYCPYCKQTQWLWSLTPVKTDEWVCTKCQHPFLLDTKAVAHSWLNTITFWSLIPIALLWTILFLILVKPDKWILAILLGVPVFSVGLALVVYAVCIPIAGIVASRITGKVTGRERGLRTVIREVS